MAIPINREQDKEFERLARELAPGMKRKPAPKRVRAALDPLSEGKRYLFEEEHTEVEYEDEVFLRDFLGGLVYDARGEAAWIFEPVDLGNGRAQIIDSRSTLGTFTRATVAWTKLGTGLWAQVASGVPRYAYAGFDTAVGAALGYFTELAGTQLVTPTASIRDMTDASWAVVTMTKAKTATGIDGVANSASTLTATGANSTVLQTLVAAATSRTYSAWVRRKTGTGTVILKHGTATLDITALINAITYTRVELNSNELNVAFGFQINTSGDALEVDFNQFEAGAVATSPMASAGAARNADTLSVPGAPWLNASEGTLLVDWRASDTSVKALLAISDGTINERLDLTYSGGTHTFEVVTGGVAQAVINVAGVSANAALRTVMTWKANTFAVSLNGGTAGTDAAGTVPTITTLYIGANYDGASNRHVGTIRRIAYWREWFPTLNVQRLSANGI